MDEKTVYFKPIRNKRTFEEISTEIKRLIVEGVFKTGDKLPSETEIARQFNVGRQTVREALRLLELSGFLRVHKGGGGGSVITNTILTTLTKTFIDAVQMQNISVKELTTARSEIEKLVLSHAITHATDEDIAILKENIARGSEKIRSDIQAFEENINFHIFLAKASHNNVFVMVVESIMAIVADFLSRIPQTLEISSGVLNDHKAILDALTERNENHAIILMDRHLNKVADKFSASFEKVARERGRVAMGNMLIPKATWKPYPGTGSKI